MMLPPLTTLSCSENQSLQDSFEQRVEQRVAAGTSQQLSDFTVLQSIFG
jgi:hypothetical protein